jgi:hypothetical protein
MKIANLDWHTDIHDAVKDATKRARPILSLRLLGRLDEDFSCANGRYFRALLYPEASVRRALREEFVLHWQSLRPVPRVTIDFGNGRTLVRTITGNSLHAVLRSDGTPVDAVLGLLSTDAFLEALRRAKPMAATKDGAELAKKHRDAIKNPPVLPPVKVSHRAFAEGAPWRNADEMVDWIYETLFLMPPDDPFLGLAAPDAFSALPA